MNITCPVKLIPAKVFSSLEKWVDTRREFVVRDDLFDDPHLVALARSITKDKVIRQFPMIAKKLNRLKAAYHKRDIHIVAQDYNFAPLALLRVLLSEKYHADCIYAAFTKCDLSGLTSRDRKQFELAKLHDVDPCYDELAHALGAEDKFVKQLAASGLKFRVQDTLVQEQKLAYGRAIATPDVLLTTPIVINGVEIHWLDYKDYVGADISFLARSNAKQCKRYVSMWGSGALVYHAVVEGWKLPGVLMLSRDELLCALPCT
jgi:Protein of unknown function TPD sequence-motif